MGGAVNRHRGVDAVEVAVAGGKLEPRLQLLERQLVREVAVDLVRRDQDEGRVRGMLPRRLEQVQGPVGVDAKVRLGIVARPSHGTAGRPCG